MHECACMCVLLEAAVLFWGLSSVTHPLSFEAGTLTEPGAPCFSSRLTDQQGLATLSSASQTQQKGSVSKHPCPAPDISRYLSLGPLSAWQALCQSDHVLLP